MYLNEVIFCEKTAKHKESVIGGKKTCVHEELSEVKNYKFTLQEEKLETLKLLKC